MPSSPPSQSSENQEKIPPIEWVKSIAATVLIAVMGIIAILPITMSYEARYVHDINISFKPWYDYYLFGIVLLYGLCLFLRIMIGYKITQKKVHFTWDMVFLTILFLLLQLKLVSIMDLKIGK